MSTSRNLDPRPRAGTTRWARPLRTTAWTVVIFILVQAALAGPATFLAAGLFELHGWIGTGTLLVAGVMLVLTVLDHESTPVRLGALVIAGGLVAQIGLGYSGRRGGLGEASAVHVPLGVALLGLSVAVAVVVALRPRLSSP